MPPTEQVEVAGFTGTVAMARFDASTTAWEAPCPADPDDRLAQRADPPGRARATQRRRRTTALRFGDLFPAVKAGGPIDFTMFGQAIAEFEFSVVRANAPIDRFARGDHAAMNAAEKRGALVFFGEGRCVSCHAVARCHRRSPEQPPRSGVSYRSRIAGSVRPGVSPRLG